jgi:hypothetical protein
MQAKKAQEEAASRLAVQVRQLLRLLPPAQTGPPASPSRLTEIHPLMPPGVRVEATSNPPIMIFPGRCLT